VIRVLVIEDDLGLNEAICDWLMFTDHAVDSASTGGEGLEKISTEGYDIVVLDWQLPDIDGVEVCATYRERGGKCPILMLTGRSNPKDEKQGRDAGADDFLAKPFTLRVLNQRLEAVLKARAAVGAA